MINKIKYIDIHGHVNFSVYDIDREAVFTRAKDAGVGMIIIGTDFESSKKAVELASQYENVWATVGVHPTDDVCGKPGVVQIFDYDRFKALALNPKVVAIGECGLDYFHPKSMSGTHIDHDAQLAMFLEHIKLANEVNKPLMLHVRNSSTTQISAYREAVSILKQHAKVRANFHFFAGTREDVEAIIDIGGMVSFTGVITFTRDYDNIIKHIPLENIMSETDCPYVSPIPYRGKRNEPVYVIEVVKALANIHEDGETAIAKQVLENAVKFFGLQ
ncbi:MAG: TatD family hydrolase [Candidatus Taylorbacteria bacterium]